MLWFFPDFFLSNANHPDPWQKQHILFHPIDLFSEWSKYIMNTQILRPHLPNQSCDSVIDVKDIWKKNEWVTPIYTHINVKVMIARSRAFLPGS